MVTSEMIDLIAKAIANVQSKMLLVTKESTVATPKFTYHYASFSTVWNSLRELLIANELCVVQDAKSGTEGVTVSTRIIHASGQWIEFGPLAVKIIKFDKDTREYVVQEDAQATGSAITYARRYSLCAALGVVTDDDDGHGGKKSNAASVASPEDKSKKIIEALKRAANQGTQNFKDEWNFLTAEEKKLADERMGMFKILATKADTALSKVAQEKKKQEAKPNAANPV